MSVALRLGMPLPLINGLQIEEDIVFQRRSWRAQRVGWALIALILLAAVLGLLGSGPLSRASAIAPGLMRVEYQRFTRYETLESFRIHLEPAATGGPVVRIGINRQYLHRSKIDSVVPPPRRVQAADDRLIYEFDVALPGRPLMVAMLLRRQDLGFLRGRVSLETATTTRAVADWWQFVYP